MMRVIFALAGALALIGCECEKKTIAEVGACDTQGRCGVTYTDGTVGFQSYFPTPGKEVAECR
jgi:hypothetical protein